MTYYRIDPKEDGTVDVILTPHEGAQSAQDAPIYILRGFTPFPMLEEYIRFHYYALCEAAEMVYP